MKFSHEFNETLQKGEFPSDWVQSAISYRLLKKCIKNVQQELSRIGLDARTLGQLLEEPPPQTAPSPHANNDPDKPASFRYSLAEESGEPRPRLVFIINTKNGVPFDIGLSQDTKAYLQTLADSQRIRKASQTFLATPENEAVREGVPENLEDRNSHSSDNRKSSAPNTVGSPSVENQEENLDGIERVEIPLTYDSEFFHLLRNEVSNLDVLQRRQEDQVTKSVQDVGLAISKVASPSKSMSKTDLYQWRDILELYIQAKVFFETEEGHEGSRSAATAAEKLQWFSDEVDKRRLAPSFRRKESRAILDQFMLVNAVLLQSMRFQEINQTAMFKILKKFDKRTSLGALQRFPTLVADEPFLAQSMAKAICFTMTTEVLATVPQLSDYLCPVCYNVSYKPIRLVCGHIFCIRCMVTMQRERVKNCPLCRGDAVLLADSANMDLALMNFLKRYFPKEVKVKQKENETAAAVDLWGEDWNRCVVM